MPTEMELTLEQTQQGVSYEVSVDPHGFEGYLKMVVEGNPQMDLQDQGDMFPLEVTPKEGQSQAENNMYSVDLKNIVPKGGLTCLFAKATSNESKLWHRRLVHINFKTMNKLVKGNLVRGLPSKLFENDQTCVACQKGKQHRAFCKSKTVSLISQPLHMLHMDLFGPTFIKSLMKRMHCLVVIDDYSSFSWVFFLATKDETSGILKSFITGVENLIDQRVKVIRCDNGTEFKNKEMNQFCERKGIKREFSVARTPQQNGVAERKNRTLIEAARTMLADSKLPTTFWAKAVNTACYVQNRVLVIKPHNKTPYKLFLGRKPALGFMRPFGCPVTIFNTIDHLGMFDGKADEGFFVGYSINSKAFRLVVAGNQSNGNACTKSCDDAEDAGFKPSGNNEKKVTDEPEKEGGDPCNKNDSVNNTNNINTASDGNSTNNVNTVSLTVNTAGIEVNVVSSNTSIELLNDPNMHELEDIMYLDNYEDVGAEADMNNLNTFIPVSPIPTTRIHKDHPDEQIIRDLNSIPHKRRMTKNLKEHEPKKVIHALKDPSWIEAMQDELLHFKLQKEQEVERGIVDTNKSRWLLKGTHKKNGLTYEGKIEEEVYVCQPPGFEDPDFPDRETKDSNEKKLIQMIKIHTNKNVADLLTYAIDVKTVNGEQQLQALVDRKKIIITEATVRRDLQLEDAVGIDCLPNATIFEQLTLMGAKTTAWNELSSTMASAIICLATNQKFNFSKYIFESMVKNLDSAGKFLMYPRFVQVFLDNQLEGIMNHNRIYIAPFHTKKVFANMKRQGKDFSVRVTPLFSTMMVQAQQEHGEADEAVYKERDDSLERATTTATGLDAEQERGNISKTQSKETPNEPSSIGTSSSGGPKRQDIMGDTIAQTRSDNVSKISNDPLLAGEITSLKRRVKKLERKKKSRSHGLKRLYKGRKIHDIDADEDITLENVHDADMFGVHDLDGDEVFVENKEPVVNAATTISTILVSAAKDLSNVDITLAQALAELKSTKPKAVTTVATTTTTVVIRPKAKWLVIQEQEQASTPITSSKNKGKGIMVEEPLKMKKKDQVLFDEQEAIRLQA
ncbi:putative ribonuclease H-like domain-containing protein [Tanacetum coccineum]